MVQVTSARGWDLEVEIGPNWLFVRPRPLEEIEPSGRAMLAEQVLALLDQTLIDRLVLELGEIDHLDGDLIEQLYWLQSRIHERDGILRICGLTGDNALRLRDHEFGAHLPHYRDREAAILGEDRPKQPR